VTLMVGGKDRTAPGADRAPPDLARTLGDYPTLARAAVRRMPQAELVEFPDLGHAPQIEAPERFNTALLAAIGR
jgi:pimeloyl-ACP methyl ester carboxylesterase